MHVQAACFQVVIGDPPAAVGEAFDVKMRHHVSKVIGRSMNQMNP